MILSNRAARKSRSIIFAFTTPPVYARFRQQTFGNDYVNLFKDYAKKKVRISFIEIARQHKRIAEDTSA